MRIEANGARNWWIFADDLVCIVAEAFCLATSRKSLAVLQYSASSFIARNKSLGWGRIASSRIGW